MPHERGWLTAQTVVVLVGDGAERIWPRATLFAHRCEILDFWCAMADAWAYARLQCGQDPRRADESTRRMARSGARSRWRSNGHAS